MKKHICKILFSVLALSLLLSACGGGVNTNNTTNPTNTVDVTNTANTPELTNTPEVTNTVQPSAKPTESPENTKSPVSSPTPASNTMSVKIYNELNYTIYYMYVSPSASDAWGEEILGTTYMYPGEFINITLDDIALGVYDYNYFDIKVIDEDGDEYEFYDVEFGDGDAAHIGFAPDLQLNVNKPDGSYTTVPGEFISNGGGSEIEDDDDLVVYYPVTFRVNNSSAYDIYAIYLSPFDNIGDYFDVLPEILSAGTFYTVTCDIRSDQLNTDEWTIRVQDVDGDETTSYYAFDVWSINDIEISWDSDLGEYTFVFVY